MKIIKGFVIIEQYISNIVGTVAPLGEISTWSSTFAKDKGYYVDSVRTGYTLVTFKNNDSVSGAALPVTNSQTVELFNLVQSMIAYSTARIRPHVVNDFRTSIQNEYTGVADTLIFGPLVDNGTVQLPEWFSYKSIPHGMAEIKIWLSDAAFRSQYEDYELTIVPPILPLNSLFGLYATITATLSSRTDSTMVDQLQEAKNGQPETYSRVFTFNLVNQFNPVEVYPVNWGVLVYGQAGDNIDIIKDTIVDYVLANSTHSRANWEALMPDLFKRTEFVMVPRWDQVSVANLSSASELYSSMLNPIECVTFFKTNITFYNETHINSYIKIFPYDYKAITVMAVSGPSNAPAKLDLVNIFPDYVPVSSMTLDFGRMEIMTRDWVVMMEKLLIAAETVTLYSSVPIGVRRIIKGGVLFVSGVYDNINYLVACKANTFYQ